MVRCIRSRRGFYMLTTFHRSLRIDTRPDQRVREALHRTSLHILDQRPHRRLSRNRSLLRPKVRLPHVFTQCTVMLINSCRYGTKSMFWYISVCSMIGGISVSVTTGLGAAIVQTAYGDNQFNKTWFLYFLLVFVIVTLLTEVFYLNKVRWFSLPRAVARLTILQALACYNTAMVTPTYYVICTPPHPCIRYGR